MSISSSVAAARSAPRSVVVEWAALWTVYLVWGSTYLAIRVVVETLPPLLSAGARFIAAGLVMYAWLALRGGRARVRVTLREIGASALVGSALLLGGNGVVAIAEQTVPSGLAALIIASVPLWVIVLRALFGDRASGGTLVGVVVGFAGVGLLVGSQTGGGSLGGVILLVLASVSWATGSFFSSKLPLPKDPFVSTSVQMLTGGGALVVAGLAGGEMSGLDVGSFSAASLFSLGYLVVFGSLLAFTAYTWLLHNAPISKVSTYAYVNPVVAVFLGWLILSETITVTMLVGAAVIVASVAFIVRHEVRVKRAAEAERLETVAPGEPGAHPADKGTAAADSANAEHPSQPANAEPAGRRAASGTRFAEKNEHAAEKSGSHSASPVDGKGGGSTGPSESMVAAPPD